VWSNQHLCNLREGGLEPNCRPSCVATRNSVLSDPGLLIGVDMIPVFSSHYHFSLDDHNSDTMVLECRWPQHEERPLRRKIRRQKLEFSIISDIVKGLLDAAREFHNDKVMARISPCWASVVRLCNRTCVQGSRGPRARLP